MLYREVQHYLVNLKERKSKPRNGCRDVVIDEIAMTLYCARKERNYSNGNYVYALPEKYLEAGEYLSQHLKLGRGTKAEEKITSNTPMG